MVTFSICRLMLNYIWIRIRVCDICMSRSLIASQSMSRNSLWAFGSCKESLASHPTINLWDSWSSWKQVKSSQNTIRKTVLLYEGETTQETGEGGRGSGFGDKGQGRDTDTALCRGTESDLIWKGSEGGRDYMRRFFVGGEKRRIRRKKNKPEGSEEITLDQRRPAGRPQMRETTCLGDDLHPSWRKSVPCTADRSRHTF